METNTIVKILFPLYALLAGLFALAIAYQKRENDAANYCMNHVYRELSDLNRRMDDIHPDEN